MGGGGSPRQSSSPLWENERNQKKSFLLYCDSLQKSWEIFAYIVYNTGPNI